MQRARRAMWTRRSMPCFPTPRVPRSPRKKSSSAARLHSQTKRPGHWKRELSDRPGMATLAPSLGSGFHPFEADPSVGWMPWELGGLFQHSKISALDSRRGLRPVTSSYPWQGARSGSIRWKESLWFDATDVPYCDARGGTGVRFMTMLPSQIGPFVGGLSPRTCLLKRRAFPIDISPWHVDTYGPLPRDS